MTATYLDVLALAGAAMVLANLVLFGFARRLGWSGPLASLALISVTFAAAWALSGRLTGHPLPLPQALAGWTVLAVPVVFTLPRWNALGHNAFVATIAAVFAFLAYSGHLLAQGPGHVGNWALLALLMLLQTVTLLLLLGTMFETIDVICRTRWQGPGGARRAKARKPKVSIHVPIHSEPPELVIETLNALAALDYADFEVLVIDNNTADEALWRPVEAHCRALGPQFRFHHLMPWPGYKSGALNFAIGETAADAELIAVVDADYVVEPHFLADLTGHFDDPQVAFVQTPQDYRDGESRGRFGRALYRAYMYFFQVSMRSRNESNAIIYAGTMGLIRKAALVEVGGWSEWCITEDAELSLRLLMAGHRSVFVSETYGRGLMPLDLAGLKKQRFRWAFGGMQLLRMHFSKLADPRTPLTLAQRFGYINGGLQWLNDLLAICYTTLLLTGAGTMLLGHEAALTPAMKALLLTSPLFLFLSIVRFLWAFRVQNRCGWQEAADAMSVLIGLSWVVGIACVKGLVMREGVFLRTPKQPEQPRLASAMAVVRAEALLAFVCLSFAGALIVSAHQGEQLAREMTLALLVWQAATFLAAVRLGVWSHAQACGLDSGGDYLRRLTPQGHALKRSPVPERSAARPISPRLPPALQTLPGQFGRRIGPQPSGQETNSKEETLR